MLTREQKSRIKQYLRGVDREAFAKKLNISKGMAAKILTGNASISAIRAKEIERVTDGLVPAKILRPDVFAI